MDKITCITPTYNRLGLLKKAITSTMVQTYTNWEMIIVDDGSSDGTIEYLTDLSSNEPRIKFFRNPGKGPNAARNFGLKNASGKYVVFLDDDDEHLPNRFENQLKAINRSKLEFIVSGFQYKDIVTDQILNVYRQKHTKTGAGVGNGIRWMVSREALFKAGLFDESMPAMQEVELSYRLANITNYAIHNEVVVNGGINHKSITSSKERIIKGYEMLMEKHHNNMHPIEAGSWYLVLGVSYYLNGNRKKGVSFIKEAAKFDYRGIYRFAYFYSIVFFYFGWKMKGINQKIIYKILNYKMPTIVYHPVID